MSYHNGPRIVTDGLVLYLDAGNSKSYPGTGSTWFDLSGNSNSGILTNGPIYNTSNRGVFDLDGTNDYIIVNKTISNFGITSDATLLFWAKITLLSRWTGVVGFNSTSGFSSTAANFSLDLNPSNNLRVWKNNTVIFGGTIITNNTWNLFTITSSSSGFNFYFNNNLIISNSTTTGNIVSTNNLVIGDNWDNNLQGSISSVLLYNKTFDINDIRQNYNALKGRYNL